MKVKRCFSLVLLASLYPCFCWGYRCKLGVLGDVWAVVFVRFVTSFLSSGYKSKKRKHFMNGLNDYKALILNLLVL